VLAIQFKEIKASEHQVESPKPTLSAEKTFQYRTSS
jgi:hypothetical protein